LANITRDQLGNLNLTRLVVELFMDEFRYEALDIPISQAYRDGGLGFAWDAFKAQAFARFFGKLDEKKDQFRSEQFWNKNEIKERLEEMGYRNISDVIAGLESDYKADSVEIASTLLSLLDKDNSLNFRRELEGLLRLPRGHHLYQERYGALKRLLSAYDRKTKRLERMDEYSAARRDGEELGIEQHLGYAKDFLLEIVDNIPGMAKNAVIISAVALLVIGVPGYLVKEGIKANLRYNEARTAMEADHDGQLALLYAGLRGERSAGSVSGELWEAWRRLDYDTWLEPVWCTDTDTDSEGNVTTTTYICDWEREYDFPNPGPARERLLSADAVAQRIDDISKEERAQLEALIRETFEIAESLPLDYEIEVYEDIYSDEMNRIAVRLSFSNEMYKEHYARISPEKRSEFENAYSMM
ncbi:hypothetical protein COY95_00055, partial [Candidatus Woesearchaeota archaeon CG_4_10_14_0_8_um_filter_47_5]